MGRFADATGPGVFDEAQAKAYAAAIDIETDFPHSTGFSGGACQARTESLLT